jgi:iron complex transport system substrate-binding protein
MTSRRDRRQPIALAASASLAALVTLSAFVGARIFASTPVHAAQAADERLVVIAKDYNEILWALGAEDRVVGVDLSSTYPPDVRRVPTVGYHRALTAEGILSLRPTLILHDGNIGPPHVVEQLHQLGIPMRSFEHHSDTVPGAEALMRELGAAFHKESRAEELCAKLERDLEAARVEVARHTGRPRVVVIHFGRASNVFLVMKKESAAGKMIELAGGEMAIAGGGMGQLTSPEIIAQADPDVLLLTDYGFDRLGSETRILELPGVAGTAAARGHRIYRVEEHDLAYFGPRAGENVLALARLLHPPA